MWKPEHRIAADRGGLRYPSDLTDAEWVLVEPLIPPAKHGGRRRSVNVRESRKSVAITLDGFRMETPIEANISITLLANKRTAYCEQQAAESALAATTAILPEIREAYLNIERACSI